MTTDQSATQRAQEAAGTAADEGRHVAGTARQEAQNVASEAATQARNVLGDTMGQVSSQLGSQSSEQKTKLASTLRTLGEDLDSMAGRGTPGLASDLARQASGHARTLGEHLESREPSELLDDVRRFARRRPGTFLLGALAAGVVVGRLARGAADGIAAAEGGASPAPTTPVTPTEPPTYMPSPSTETGPAHGQPTREPPVVPETPPMATPQAGYGERGVLGDEGPR